MSSPSVTVRERHKPKELGTRATHGSSEFGFDPHPPINSFYGSQFSVDADRVFESDAYALRLQTPLSLTGSWQDVLSITLSGSVWIILGSGEADGAAAWRVFDGVAELALAHSPAGVTVPVYALVQPRTGAAYSLQAMGSGNALAQVCSLVAIRAFT